MYEVSKLFLNDVMEKIYTSQLWDFLIKIFDNIKFLLYYMWLQIKGCMDSTDILSDKFIFRL